MIVMNGKRRRSGAATGTLDGNATGTREGMGSITTTGMILGSLAAEVTLDVETNTLQAFVEWQVSTDGSTWVLVSNGSQNAAAVVIGTGTAGADAAITRLIEAPMSVYAYPYARAVVRNEVAAGLVADTYSCVYTYLDG